MTFTALPFWGVLGLLGAVATLLGLLHLLRVRPRVVRVVTTLFWAHAVERTQARTLLERFRHPLTYALLLAICGLVIVSLGRPERNRTGRGLREVILLDAGNNMTARDAGGTGHLDLAREAVLAEAARLSGSDRLAVVVLDPLPRLVHGFADPPALLGRALEAVQAARLPASRELAFKAAHSLIGGEEGRVVLVSNRPEATGDDATRVIRVGEACGNAAIVSVLFVPDEVNPLQGRLIARVAHRGPAEGRVDLQIARAGGAVLLKESAVVPANGTHDFAVSDLAADGDRLVMRLAPAEGASGDDELALRLPSRSRVRVAVSPGVPGALRVGLRSDPAVTVVDAGQPHDVEVRAGTSETTTAVPTLIVDTSEVATTGAANGNPLFTFASNQPLLAGLTFEGGQAVPADGPAAALIEAGGDWLAAYVPGKPSRVVMNQALWSEGLAIYRQPAFAVLLTRAVRQLAGWDPEPIALAPVRQLEDPLWPERAALAGEAVVLPADRDSANLSASAKVEAVVPASGAWGRLELFELLLLLAGGLFLAETYLQTRGRIA